MKRVLFLDDDLNIANSIKEDLQEYGYEIDLINHPEKALVFFEKKEYDAILLDLMMPIPELFTLEEKEESNMGMNTGQVIMNRIRRINPKIPILIYSARSKIKTDDYSVFIRKPVFTKELAEILKDLIK